MEGREEEPRRSKVEDASLSLLLSFSRSCRAHLAVSPDERNLDARRFIKIASID